MDNGDMKRKQFNYFIYCNVYISKSNIKIERIRHFHYLFNELGLNLQRFYELKTNCYSSKCEKSIFQRFFSYFKLKFDELLNLCKWREIIDWHH